MGGTNKFDALSGSTFEAASASSGKARPSLELSTPKMASPTVALTTAACPIKDDPDWRCS
jgi:hypothetical protein